MSCILGSLEECEERALKLEKEIRRANNEFNLDSEFFVSNQKTGVI